MTIASYIKQLDHLLKPKGFMRQRHTWNRRFAEYIDVVDIQVAKSGDALTVNLGVLEPEAYAAVWNEPLPALLKEPLCIVRTRLSLLVHQSERWWDLNDKDGPLEIFEVASSFGLPFLSRMHSIGEMKDFLEEQGVRKLTYPLPSIYLGILLIRGGETAAGCSLLRDRASRTTGPWRSRIAKVIERLCKTS